MTDISRKGVRRDLPARREPHWHRLDTGAYLGFRRGPDTWVARFRDRSGEQHYHALKVPAEARDAFIEAKRLAEDWFAQMGGAATRSARRGTVRDAVDAYLAGLQQQGRAEAAKVLQRMFRVILPDSDALAGLKLEDARREDFEAWRQRMLKGRQPQSVNRYTGAMAAALNASLELGHVGDARAWNLKLLTNDQEHDEQTAVFLTPAQRKAVVANAEPAMADFLRGLELTGCRPGELARASVRDFDGEKIRFSHRKGRPPKLRVRYTVLSEEGVKFFARVAKDKPADAPLCGNPDGVHWPRASWGDAARKAFQAHQDNCNPADRLPDAVSTYAFRHSRISELLQVHGIDPLTVAMQTGTSLYQIEKTYFKFIPQAMKAKLAAVKDSA